MRLKLITLFGLFIGLFITLPVSAQSSDAETCVPLDVIVLLDQSSSMAFTDPMNVRVEAVKTLIGTLYDHAAYRCRETLYRIGVIGFGDDARSLISFDMPEGQIRVTADDNPQDWIQRREAAANLVIAENRVNSSYRAPLDLADSMLLMSAGDGLDNSRERVVIAIMDGTPCTRIAFGLQLAIFNGARACSSPQWIQQYLLGNVGMLQSYSGANYRALGFDFEDGMANFLVSSERLSGDTSFNIVFFTPANQVDSYAEGVHDALQTLTESRGGLYFSPQRIGGDLRQIFTSLDQIVTPYLNANRTFLLFTLDDSGRCVGTFVLEPYLSSATLVTMLNNADGSPPELVNPLGEAVEPTTRTQLNSQYALSDPLPGVWTIYAGGDCETADAAYETLPIDLWMLPITQEQRVVPEPPYFDEETATSVTFDLFNAFGDRVALNEDYPLEICGTFITTSPTADAALWELGCYGFTNSANGWISETPLPAPVRGTYLLRVAATTSTADPNREGETFTVFNTELTYTAIETP